MTPRRRRPNTAESDGTTEFDEPAEAEPVPEEEQERVARTVALRQLAAQPRTRAELDRAMRRRGVTAPVAERVLDRLAELRLVDDSAFANAWVETRHVGRGLSRRALTHELTHRGVATDEITEAVDRLDPETELATARALVDRKLRATRGLETPARMRRAASLLARKGYPASVALRVVREAIADERATDSGDPDVGADPMENDGIDALLTDDASDDGQLA